MKLHTECGRVTFRGVKYCISVYVKYLTYLPANLILSKSNGCNTSVDTTPPVIPAIKCSIRTARNVAASRVNRLAVLFDVDPDWLPAMFSISLLGAF